jgi:hypothetical protein
MDRVLEVLTKQLDEHIKRLSESLIRFHAKDFSEYARMCGEIKGLLEAREYINTLFNNLEDDKD